MPPRFFILRTIWRFACGYLGVNYASQPGKPFTISIESAQNCQIYPARGGLLQAPENQRMPKRNLLLCALLNLCQLAWMSASATAQPAAMSAQPSPESTLKAATLAAFNRDAAVTGAHFQKELAPGARFLEIDLLDEEARGSAYQSLKSGAIRIERLETLEGGKPIRCPDGIIHHWIGTIFIPGATLADVLRVVQDYDHQSQVYSPDVEQSRTISRNGDDFHILLRFRRKKVITVVLDTEHDVHYTRLDATHAASRSASTSIREVENAGTPKETALPADSGGGYLWRINAYWKFMERDGGTYVQCETISLTRDIPTGLGWLVGPFVTSIPRESLSFTLDATRKALTKK